MDEEALRQIQETLRKRLNETLPLAAGLRDSLEGIQAVKEAMDDFDLISNKCLCDMTSRLHGRAQQVTMEILGALRRMAMGDFGVCDECGNDIGIERLRAQPTATLCVDCRRCLERRGRSIEKARHDGLGLAPGSSFQRVSNEGQGEHDEVVRLGNSLSRLQKLLSA